MKNLTKTLIMGAGLLTACSNYTFEGGNMRKHEGLDLSEDGRNYFSPRWDVREEKEGKDNFYDIEQNLDKIRNPENIILNAAKLNGKVYNSDTSKNPNDTIVLNKAEGHLQELVSQYEDSVKMNRIRHGLESIDSLKNNISTDSAGHYQMQGDSVIRENRGDTSTYEPKGFGF